MGGTPNTTLQQNANPLATLFANSQGYQQMPQAGAGMLTQPTYPTPAITPEQAALLTQQRMQARNPVAPPVIQKPTRTFDPNRGGNGSAGGRGSGGAW